MSTQAEVDSVRAIMQAEALLAHYQSLCENGSLEMTEEWHAKTRAIRDVMLLFLQEYTGTPQGGAQ